MRFTVTVPDDVEEQIRTYSEKEGLSKSEWINKAIGEKLVRSAPGYAPPGAADGAAKDALLKERADEIAWLRGENAKLTDKLTPALLPEKAGEGRTWLSRLAFWR